MKKSTFYVAALLILVIVIAVLGVLIVQRKAPAEPEPSDAPAIHPPVEETADPPSSAPAQTAAPTDAPEPTSESTPKPTVPPVMETRPPLEEPEESPAPTAAPVIADASGSFRSDTGTGMNLKVDWRTYSDENGARKLRVDVSTVSYSFFIAAQYRSIVLTVDGKTYTADCPGGSYDGETPVETPMASFTVDAPTAAGPASVVWHYNGTYSGKELNDITAAGTVG